MDTLARKLRRLIEGVPEGGAVTLPREAVAQWLQEVGEGAGSAETNGRPEVADLTVEEIAEALELSPSTVRAWMPDVAGAYKLGGAWRVSRADWRAYLDRRAEDEEEGPAEVRSRPSAELDDWRDEREDGRE